jgi:hypothetical protein
MEVGGGVDLVVTGEGRLDEQTLNGKGGVGVGVGGGGGGGGGAAADDDFTRSVRTSRCCAFIPIPRCAHPTPPTPVKHIK